jgi:dihydropyrimidinase
MPIDLIIENGTVVTSLGVVRTDVAIDGGKVMEIGPRAVLPSAQMVVDAKGKIVLPGGIDPHSHFELEWLGSKLRETWDLGTAATAIGGTTTTIDFAAQDIGQSLLDAVKTQLARADESSAVDFSTKQILQDFTDLNRILEGMEKVVKYGIRGFKGATIFREANWYEDDWQLYSVLNRVQELGAVMTLHAENCYIGEEKMAELVRQGYKDARYWPISKPNFVEYMEVEKCMTLAKVTGAQVYIVHTSTMEGIDIIARYRREGLPVYCETCTHYLILTEEVYEKSHPEGFYYTCSPPIRRRNDVEALWKGIREGRVQLVGSDHVAYTKQQKTESDVFSENPDGFPGCEVRLALVFDEGVNKRGLSLERFVEITSTNAAKVFGLYPQKGVIAPGSDADIVIFDPSTKHSLNAKDLHMETDLSVYEGMVVTGWPSMTFLRGKLIAEDNKYIGEPGEGKFVKARLKGGTIDGFSV